jgi:hypothetical protein
MTDRVDVHQTRSYGCVGAVKNVQFRVSWDKT